MGMRLLNYRCVLLRRMEVLAGFGDKHMGVCAKKKIEMIKETDTSVYEK